MIDDTGAILSEEDMEKLNDAIRELGVDAETAGRNMIEALRMIEEAWPYSYDDDDREVE